MDSCPFATCKPGSVLGRVVKLEMLQKASAPNPVGDTDAPVQLTLTAEVGTVVQPVKFDAVVPTLKVQGLPLLLIMVNVTVALELPAMLLPGLFAANVMVDGVASKLLALMLNGSGERGRLPNWITGVGWRGFTDAF